MKTGNQLKKPPFSCTGCTSNLGVFLTIEDQHVNLSAVKRPALLYAYVPAFARIIMYQQRFREMEGELILGGGDDALEWGLE